MSISVCIVGSCQCKLSCQSVLSRPQCIYSSCSRRDVYSRTTLGNVPPLLMASTIHLYDRGPRSCISNLKASLAAIAFSWLWASFSEPHVKCHDKFYNTRQSSDNNRLLLLLLLPLSILAVSLPIVCKQPWLKRRSMKRISQSRVSRILLSKRPCSGSL
jgi:hypothetical protein